MRWLTFILSMAFSTASSKHVLMVFPISLRSKRIQLDPLIERLLKQGHEVTAFFSFPSSISHRNYHEKVIPDSAIDWYERFSEKVFLNEAGPDLGSFNTFKTMLQQELCPI